jgi:hypothetical protein
MIIQHCSLLADKKDVSWNMQISFELSISNSNSILNFLTLKIKEIDQFAANCSNSSCNSANQNDTGENYWRCWCKRTHQYYRNLYILQFLFDKINLRKHKITVTHQYKLVNYKVEVHLSKSRMEKNSKHKSIPI